jgi:ABC-type sugar transport system substrate-binding protein
VDAEVVFANNDAINQSQQLLKAIQGDKGARPDAIIFEPASGTALPHVATAAHHTASSWLRLSTSQRLPVNLLCAQNDAMAMGARKAFQERTDESARARWLSVPYIGVDGLPKTGQAFVRSGLLTATVIVPANTTLAMEMLVDAIAKGTQPAPLTYTVAASFPPIEELAAWREERNRGLGDPS